MSTDATLAGLLALCRAVNQKEESSELDLKCTSKMAGAQRSVIQQALEEQCRQGQKGGWRAIVRSLEEDFPEEFGEPRERLATAPEAALDRSPDSTSPDSALALEPADNVSPAQVSDELKTAKGIDGDIPANGKLPAAQASATPEPVRLPPATWFDRFIGYGANSRVVALADALACVRLVMTELQGPIAATEAQIRLEGETVTVPALYAECERLTGNAAPWGIVQALQLKARMQHSPGAPSPNQDQSQMTPGFWPVSPDQPRSVARLNEPGGAQRDWMSENGLWCG